MVCSLLLIISFLVICFPDRILWLSNNFSKKKTFHPLFHFQKGFISSAFSIRAVTNNGIEDYLGFSITSWNVKNSEIDMSQEEKCFLISLLVRLITNRVISGFPQYNLRRRRKSQLLTIEYLVFPLLHYITNWY